MDKYDNDTPLNRSIFSIKASIRLFLFARRLRLDHIEDLIRLEIFISEYHFNL